MEDGKGPSAPSVRSETPVRGPGSPNGAHQISNPEPLHLTSSPEINCGWNLEFGIGDWGLGIGNCSVVSYTECQRAVRICRNAIETRGLRRLRRYPPIAGFLLLRNLNVLVDSIPSDFAASGGRDPYPSNRGMRYLSFAPSSRTALPLSSR